MKARSICAVLGIALAVATVIFLQSLVTTNDYQAEAIAYRLLTELPVAEGTKTCRLALDYRPDGRVMQGPPMLVCANDGATELPPGSCRASVALFAQRKVPVPPLGSELTLIGRKGAYRVKLAALDPWDRPVRGYPNLFVSPETAATLAEEWSAWEPVTFKDLAPRFRSDAQRNFDQAKALLLWAAALTALCLLVNTLFLSIESMRRDVAVLRILGMTRGTTVMMRLTETWFLSVFGWVLGKWIARGALSLWVRWNSDLFPMGAKVAVKVESLCLVALIVIALVAVLIALRPILSVRPLEAAVTAARPVRRRHLGMIVSFAFGFGSFVAVEVWGGSLMRAFVPSPEWPDAIVSILPGGVSSFDIEKVQHVEGVRKIAELQPLQVNLAPLEELSERGGGEAASPRRGSGPKAYRNALLLASDWLPEFRFTSGTREAALEAMLSGDACIITEMMARARKLNVGDALTLDCGRGLTLALKVVGIIDLNWHMVTSRGLVRGLNRMPVNTDGPVFVSFDTLASCDPRPQEFVRMTHLWLDYEDDFEQENGAFKAGRLVEERIVSALGGANLTTKEGETYGNTVRLHARDEIADGTFAHGDELIGAMARVPFIFIAVLSLGFVSMLIGSVEARKREFVVLRTIGATRLQLAKILTGEALGAAMKGILYGTPCGALAGWLFTFGTRKLMANWGLPPSFALPALPIFLGALGAIAFVLIVALPTSLVLVRRKK